MAEKPKSQQVTSTRAILDYLEKDLPSEEKSKKKKKKAVKEDTMVPSDTDQAFLTEEDESEYEFVKGQNPTYVTGTN